MRDLLIALGYALGYVEPTKEQQKQILIDKGIPFPELIFEMLELKEQPDERNNRPDERQPP